MIFSYLFLCHIFMSTILCTPSSFLSTLWLLLDRLFYFDLFYSNVYFQFVNLFINPQTINIISMSHLRDLQRLRNTRNNFQIKRNVNHHPAELRLNEPTKPRRSNHHNQLLMMPEFVMPRVIQLDPEASGEAYSKYLQSKELLTARQSRQKNNQPRAAQKSKLHKRESSFGVAGTYFDKKSREIPQSGLTVYNFTLKLGSTQIASSQTSQLNRKSLPITSRNEKVPQLMINNEISQSSRQNKQLKSRRDKLNPELDPSCLMGKNAYQILYPVGKGGFGKVWKVKSKKSSQIYAMKEMQKSKIINKKSINSVMNQRTLLAQLQHPFLVNMICSFQDRQNLYLVMDYLNGGDLRYHIGTRGKFNQVQTKFFIANIIIGLQYLHQHKIIHRDLKPQNFVLDSDGYLHITDLGVSRIVREDNSQDTSGTPGYMAPQVICHKNHTYTADYFALGVMGYEFMLGRRPYNGKNRKQIRQHILTKQVQIKIDELPYKWSPKAADFINQLLQRSPEKRLGANGIEEIKNHPWLADVDWKSIQNKTSKSPYIPLSIEQNYEDYKQQISEDTIDENIEQTRMMLRDIQVQALFEGYDLEYNKSSIRKRSLRSTNHTDTQQVSLRGSCK